MWRRVRVLVWLALALLTLAILWRVFVHEMAATVAPAAAPVQPAPQPAPRIVSTAQNPGTSDLILDLFNPSEHVLANQRQASLLTRQIEEAIVALFILRRCDMVSNDDYAALHQTLQRYIVQTGLADTAHAAAELQRITQSANASYSLIYSRTACDAPPLAHARAQLLQWQASMEVQ